MRKRPFGRRPAPRHMVGSTPRPVAPRPVAAAEVTLGADELEVAPVARVQRSRLAFALAVTLAALPVIALDNLPATAEANESHVEVGAGAVDSSSSSESSTRVTVAPSSTTSSTEAPTTTAVAESSTTEAPTSTTEAPVIQAVQASAPAPTAPPATSPPSTSPPPRPGDPNDPATWDRLAQCESDGRWSLNTGNGYYGGLQFSLATWQNVGGAGYPHQATKAEQVKRGKILQARAGWGQWPHCARALGYM